MRRMAKTYLKNLLLMANLIVCFENVMAQGSKDYQVEFSRIVFNQYGREDKRFDESSASPTAIQKSSGPELLETRPFKMKGCIKPSLEKLLIIKDRAAFKKAILADIPHDQCLKILEEIDFSKYTLLGTTIKSYSPLSAVMLKYQTVKDEVKKQYLLDVGYPEVNNMCRCLYTLDAWFLVPKLPVGYDVNLWIKTIPS